MSGSSPRVRGTAAQARPRGWGPRFIPARAGNSPPASARSPASPVHPRACGEQVDFAEQRRVRPGSSPRVRGTVSPCARSGARRRFIPARAGNSHSHRGHSAAYAVHPARAGNSFSNRDRSPNSAVHPRACGEQHIPQQGVKVGAGSSPRVRGTGELLRFAIVLFRFIPARAGNSLDQPPSVARRSVHPRACGEQMPLRQERQGIFGSSPRVRGTVCVGTEGSRKAWFIPARAGNRVGRGAAPRSGAVHPRACGEQPVFAAAQVIPNGSSPRVRGTVTIDPESRAHRRFIPARAGNRPRQTDRIAWLPVHPRACGEQATADRQDRLVAGSSPRVRGTVHQRDQPRLHARFIPARAGNRGFMVVDNPHLPVHPRACGEQTGWTATRMICRGSSPRVRGTARRGLHLVDAGRFIPARAGNSVAAKTTLQPAAVHPRACGEQA